MKATTAVQKRPLLVIDDDPQFVESVTLILRHAGFSVVSALDGSTAIELAQTAQPSVILLDMILPGLDGLSICKRLKQHPILADIPVIAITASQDLQYTGEAFYAGVEFFLPKPFTAEKLVSVVKMALETTQSDIPMRLRFSPRYPVELVVRCLIQEDAQTIREVVGHTRDLSLRGVLIWLPEMLAPQTVLNLQLKLPNGTVTAEGEVIWQDYNSVDRAIPHGVKFLHFAENSSQLLLRHFVSRLTRGNAAPLGF